MKIIIFLLALTFASVYCEEDSSSAELTSEEAIESLKLVSEILKSKLNVTFIDDLIRLANKTKTKCPDIDDKIDSAFDEISTCMDSIDTGSETFCSLTRKNFLRCAEPVRKVIAGCFPEESKDLPGFFFKITLALIDQACNSTVEQILELLNPCQLESEFTTFEPCKKIYDVFVEHKDKLPSKSLICKTLPKVKECAKSHQDASCKNPITRQSLLQFYEAVDDAVAEDCQSINRT